MSDNNSTPTSGNGTPGTVNLIREALCTATPKLITRNPAYLDDEKLPEEDRIAVLREIFHRNIRLPQLTRLARALSPAAQGVLPPNLLIYGPSGAGKSVTSLHFLDTLAEVARDNGLPFHYYYLDLSTPKTCFGALNEFLIALDPSARRYRKGVALEQMQLAIIAALSGVSGVACVLIDEADNITKDGDVFLTFLAKTLPKRVPARLCYVFLTNRLEWEKGLDPRMLAVLKKQDVLFEPYGADDLLKILELRVEKALDKSKVDEVALRKIAALASREAGDARKAVELLAKAVKLAEEGSGLLGVGEVDAAESLLEVDKTEAMVQSLAPQQKLALRACYVAFGRRGSRLSTGDAYQEYARLCDGEGVRALSQRRSSDLVSFLDVYGLVNARVQSLGRYGTTRVLSASLPSASVGRFLRASAPV